MKDQVRILGFAGSLRQGSFNKAILRAALGFVPPGATMEVFDLEGMPLFNEDWEKNPPATVKDFKAKIRAADGILIATPEYNYSVPGVLKNAIDCASRPYGDSAFGGQAVAVMGASVGTLGTARAQYHLRQSFVFLNLHALNSPEVMVPAAHEKIDAKGNVTDAQTLRKIKELVEAFVAWTRQARDARA